MSTPVEKSRNATRRHRDEVAIQRQLKIAKSHGTNNADVKEPHRMVKKHAMNCGRPGCMLCGNPRKIFKELTAQEKRLFQDMDSVRDVHGNGLEPTED